MEELINIQHELNAPKSQWNKFSSFWFRSCEDILAALKDLLFENRCIVNLTDEVVFIGDRYYVKATASITNAQGQTISSTAYAREVETKKGMDEGQITGGASSYARKYALNGLFAIDDQRDADTQSPEPPKKSKGGNINQVAATVAETDTELAKVLTAISAATSTDALLTIYNQYPQYHNNADFSTCLSARKKQLI